MRTAIFVLALSLIAMDLRAQEAAPADTIAADWTTTLVGIQVQHTMPTGAKFVAVCPGAEPSTARSGGPGPTPRTRRSAWPRSTWAS